MADVKFPITLRVAEDMVKWRAGQIQLNLDAKVPRASIRAKWKKAGTSWTPISHRIQRIRTNYRATGALINSIKGYVNSLDDMGISAIWYAEAIRKGRQPMGAMKGGKGIPLDAMKQWTQVRRLRPKNPETGEFIKNTESNKKSMRYLMNRKIKFFGMQAYDFMDHTREITNERYMPKLEKAMKQDIENLIDQQVKQQRNNDNK